MQTRLINPIPSDIETYLRPIREAQQKSLGAGLSGAHDAQEAASKELRQLVVELASWCGLQGTLTAANAGMGQIIYGGEELPFG